jgi:hypothetical protein
VLRAATAAARSSTATNPIPGGDMSPFCEAPTAMFTPSASMANGAAPSEAMTSATSRAGWPARSIAARIAATSCVMPLAVSVCTTKTAAISRFASARSASSTADGSIG